MNERLLPKSHDAAAYKGGKNMRFTRVVFALAAIAATALVMERPAAAVNVPAFTWAVSCADDDGAESNIDGMPVDLPSGRYLVVAVGDCQPDVTRDFGVTTGTPCSPPTTGPVPCVTTTADNIPGELCWNSLLFATVQLCSENRTADARLNGCSTPFGVIVDEQCLAFGGAGIIDHDEGPMRARFNDTPAGAHFDNGGVFLVTAVFTPL